MPFDEVRLRVVDRFISAERTQHGKFRGGIDHRHVRAASFQHLNSDGTDAASSAVDERALSLHAIAGRDQVRERDVTGCGDGGRLLERHVWRLQCQTLLRGRRGLCKRTPIAEGEAAHGRAENFVTRLETRHSRSDRFDDAGDVGARDWTPR